MNIRLFVSSFGNDTSWVRKIIKNAVTIEVGAACREIRETGNNVILDNTGDNISSDNPYWGELTGLYWIWKNIKFNDDDIIGFCHYNKMLNVSERDIKKFFRENPRGWLVMDDAECPFDGENIAFRSLKEILVKDFPDYYEYWQNGIYDGNIHGFNSCIKCASCNLFYTDAKSFNEYCEFLFDVLFKLRNTVGDVDWAPSDKRYCAQVSERILTAYLERNGKFYKSVGCRVEGSKKIYRILSHTAHKLNLNTNSKYYLSVKKFFRKLTHYRPAVSSWSKNKGQN